MADVQEFGRRQLLYTLLVVEVPTDEATEIATEITEEWNGAGRSIASMQTTESRGLRESAVVPAAFTTTTTSSEIRISKGLSDEQAGELVRLGKVISSPKVLGEEGTEVSVRLGRDVPFITAYAPAKDANGNDTATMQPVITTIHDGIQLNMTGTLDDRQEIVHLKLSFADAQLKGTEDTFTYETEDGPLTVQQPEVTSRGIQTTCDISINKAIALCSGPKIRETVAENGVPLVRRIPYVGKLFRNTAKATESVSTIILIRCQEHDAAHP